MVGKASMWKFACRSVKKLRKLDFTDFYYYAEQKIVSLVTLVTSLFENPFRSVKTKNKAVLMCGLKANINVPCLQKNLRCWSLAEKWKELSFPAGKQRGQGRATFPGTCTSFNWTNPDVLNNRIQTYLTYDWIFYQVILWLNILRLHSFIVVVQKGRKLYHCFGKLDSSKDCS